MAEKVIIAPDEKEISGPVVFLAGPIQGAEDWQKEAIKIIHSLNSDIWVASPRREYLPGEFIYEKQVDWETKYLRLAAKQGVILFWLAKEKENTPLRAYAQTSRFELAEWKVRHEREGVKLVIGIEDGFSGARYIKHRFFQDCPEIKIFQNLQDVCKEAVKLILK